MAKISPQQAAEKYVRRTTAAVPDMVRGVENVTIAPTLQAAAKEQKMLTNLTASIQSGKWKRGLERVSLQDWQTAMKEKGAQRVAAGVQAAQGKVEQFYSELFPYQADAQKVIASMPDLTLEDSIARMTAWTRKMSDFRKRTTR